MATIVAKAWSTAPLPPRSSISAQVSVFSPGW
jgi:hypothetical protein